MNRLKQLKTFLIPLFILSIGLNIFLLLKLKSPTEVKVVPEASAPHFDDAQKISDIQHFLDSISTDYISEVKSLSEKYKIPSWGCGPSSFALAELINKKFFENKLRVDASYDNHPYEMLIRGGFAAANPQHLADVNSVDHAWIEIYFKDQMLFIDPTIAQFGKANKIAYATFKVGDPNISNILHDQFGIYDVRLRLMVKKAVARAPEGAEPYPGQSINPDYLEYYRKAAEDLNMLDEGKIPDEWKDWIKTLESKFI